MKTVLDILKKAGGWRHGLYLHIDNPPFMALVIEATDESGPCGLPAISVCHYGEQNGDAMRDPEMLFEVSRWRTLNPYYWRNDYVGIEQWSRSVSPDGQFIYNRRLHAEQQLFAQAWDDNLQQQSFLKAFTDRCILG